MQVAVVPRNPAVFRNPVQIAVCKQALSQGAESDDAESVLSALSKDPVPLNFPVKDGLAPLIHDQRKVDFSWRSSLRRLSASPL